MSIDVNAIEQTVVVTAVGDEVNVNIIDQPVLVSVTDQIIEVEASGGTGPQGPAGAGVAAGGTTGQVLSKASGTNYDTVWVNAGAGTVYSVDASGSTGISVTGGPITGAGTLTITNTAPDKVVALTGAGTAVITGTYPNFTITTNDEFDGTVTSVNLTAGTGISVSGGPITGSGSISVTNTAPDQVVSLTGGGTTTISGTYPNFTITSTDSKVGTVTSVDMTVPTGLTISGNPITSAGTLALALASGYSIPTTASQANWNTAYNDSITSASVSGTSTKTLTLNQQDGGTVTASWSDTDTGLTSVGLSMPSAFAVSNSPLTSNGTIAVTGAGTSAQYVRGDGQLANFPTNGGGGSSVNYYLNGSVSQGTFGGDTYYEMSKTPIIGAGTNFTRTNAQGNGYIASFITDAGDPALLNIPGGNWNVEFYFQASSGGGNPSFYAELYKVSSSNVFTLIASGSTNPEGITNGTVVDQYFTSIPVPQTALLATDRIAVRIFVTPDGRNITLHTEDNNLCEVLTTFSTGLNALNGLTDQVQYFATSTIGTDFNIQSLTDTHTFNLPVASGSNTGKLSNVDWLTFDGKENVLTFSAPLSRSVNTVSIPVATTSQPGYLDSTDWTTFNAKVTSVSATSPLFSTGGKTPTLTIQQASGSQNGYLSSTDWTTFNSKQNTITLTTTGSSGASTFISNTLNVPTYTLSGLGGVPTTRQLTINGTAYDLSADRSWTIPVHDAVTIGTANGLSLSTQVLSLGLASSSANGALSSTDWSTFNGKQNAITLTTTGTSGAATLVGSTLNIPQYADQFVGTVTSVSALTIGTTGTDLSSSVANGTTTPVITLNVPTASATNRGALSSADWTTFNSKQAALNGTGFVKISGTTISYDNSTYYLASNPSAYIALTALTASAPLSYNNTTGAFTISQASGSVNGFLSSTDWTTFNNKQNTITNPVTGTGTTNYLPKWTSGSAIGNSLVYDDGTKVGINTASPASTLDINGTSFVRGGQKVSGYFATSAGDGYILNIGVTGNIGYLQSLNGTTPNTLSLDGNDIRFRIASFSEAMRITSGGNLLVNSTTDNGNRLQVTGNGYFSGNLFIGKTNSALSNTTGTEVVAGGIFAHSSSGNGYIDLGATRASVAANIGGVVQFRSVYRNSDSDNTTIAFIKGFREDAINNIWRSYLSFETTNADGFTISEKMRITSGGNVGIGTTNPDGNLVVAAGTNGTASTGGYIGLTTGVNNSKVRGAAIEAFTTDTSNNHGLRFYTNSGATTPSVRMILDSSGNLGLGVTPSAWGFGGNLELPGTNNISFKDTYGNILSNAYYSLSNSRFQYTTNGFAAHYQIGDSGSHKWFNAPSGTAGNAITFTQAMTLTANGRLLLGTTTEGTQRLQVVGTSYFSDSVGIATTSPATFGKLAVSVSGTGSKAGIGISNGGFNGTNASPTEISLLELFTSVGTAPTGIYSLNTYYDTSAAWLAFKTTNAAGTTSTALTLASNGAATFSSSVTAVSLTMLDINNSFTAKFGANSSTPSWVAIGTISSVPSINGYNNAFSATTNLALQPNGGNLLVGTTTDSGYKLNINGGIYGKGITADSDGGVGNALYAYNQVLSGSSTNALIQLATTWNTTGNADAIVLDVTNTASGASSRLIDLKVGGSSIFKVQRNGRINASSLPTSSAGLSAGDIWNDGGTLKIV